MEGAFAHEGQAPGLFIRAQFAEAVHGFPDRFIDDIGHGQFLLPVFKESDPGAQRAFRQTKAIRLVEFDEIHLQDVPQRDVRLDLVAHLEAPGGLRALGLGGQEEVEVQQVQPHRGAQLLVVLTVGQLRAQGAGQVEEAALVPGAVAAHLHLDIVAVAFGVTGQHIEHDVLAGEFAGFDVGIQDLDSGDIGQVRAQVVDQGDEQVRRLGEQALEDVVVGGVEQRDHGRTSVAEGERITGAGRRKRSTGRRGVGRDRAFGEQPAYPHRHPVLGLGKLSLGKWGSFHCGGRELSPGPRGSPLLPGC